MRRLALVLTSTLIACSAEDGATGPTGRAGAPGPAGQDGVDGASGPQGDPGPSGMDGRSLRLSGPGLVFTLTGASTAAATFTVEDSDGVPLDIEGALTAGEISVSFVLAYLAVDDEGEATGYVAYTTRQQTSPITNETAIQAATDTGGSFEWTGSEYRYTYGTAINPANMGATHTVAAYATRTAFDERYVDNSTFSFRPDGQPVSVRRQVTTDEACATCHDDLSAHGGARQDVLLCQVCHTEQTVDPDTGNTVDWKVMIHKIHQGAALPSVIDGTPYQIIGFRQSVHDYSTVHFPQETSNCVVCHQGEQAERWRTAPASAACLACHDTTSFVDPPPAGFVLHGGGAQPESAPCNVCHAAIGSIAGVTDSHLTGLRDPMTPELGATLLAVRNSGPGQAPEVDFRITVDGQPLDILTTPLASLRFTVAGPNTDFAEYWQVRAQGGGSTGTLMGLNAAAGEFTYMFAPANAIPANARGSYTMAIETYIQTQDGLRVTANPPMLAFAVTDAAPVPRRTVVNKDKCNACHFDLAEHGGQRKDGAYCAMCHNPNNPNEERASRTETAVNQLIHSTDVRRMIHKIHAGENLSEPYVLGGFPAPSAANPNGGPIDFGEVRYPATLSNCTVCHEQDSFQLPMASGTIPTIEERRTCVEDPASDTNDYCDDPFWVVTATIALPPETAVCTSCHDTPAAMAHARVNTTPDGAEACAVCHGPGSGYDVDIVHAIR